jgi:hypothetical protein
MRVILPLLCAAFMLTSGCDGGPYDGSPGTTGRRDVTYIAYATGPRFRYRATLTGLYPLPVTRDTSGSVSYTYSVPCGSRVTMTTEALGAVPAGAALELLLAVQGQPLASARGASRVQAAATLRCE